MRDPIEYALGRFQNGFSCSQAILMAFGPQLELPKEVCSRIASPFGGGIVRQGETCGAVTGSLMVLGLKFGPSSGTNKDEVYQNATAFIERFKTEHASIRCQQLLSYDLSQPEELEAAKESQVFKTICPGLVRSAAGILAELLEPSHE